MASPTDLERRLTRALDRISRSMAQPKPASEDAAEVAELRAQLASERARTAQLTERVNAVKQRQESSFTTLERRLARMTEQLDLQSLEMLRLKKANTKLIEANRQLREGHEAKVIEPSAVNRALLAELEALRAERAADRTELEDVLAEMRPLLANGDSNA